MRKVRMVWKSRRVRGKGGRSTLTSMLSFSQSTEVKVTFILGMDEYFISKLMDIGLDEIE